MKLLGIIFSLILISISSFGAPFCHDVFVSRSELNPNQNYNLMVWNVNKGAHSNLQKRLQAFHRQYDFLLLQEVTKRPAFHHLFKNDRHGFAHGLKWASYESGVYSVGPIVPEKNLNLKSSSREPLLGTHKSSLFQWYPIDGSRYWLLVVNVHAINFVSQSKFQTYIHEVVNEIALHNGPLIFAGDFNTWNQYRKYYLDQKLGVQGLEHMTIGNQTPYYRGKAVDHIYIRGIEVIEAKEIQTPESDHNPLHFQFRISPNFY